MNQSAKNDLTLFQEAAEQLRFHPFLQFLRVRRATLEFSWSEETGEHKTVAVRPSEDLIAGYCGQLRGFFLSDDDWTIDRLPDIYFRLNVTRFWMLRLREIRKDLSKWKQTPARVAFPGVDNTRWGAFEIFVYGRVVHRSKASDLARIRSSAISYNYYLTSLVLILRELTYFIFQIYHCNNWVLCSLQPNPAIP